MYFSHPFHSDFEFVDLGVMSGQTAKEPGIRRGENTDSLQGSSEQVAAFSVPSYS